MALLQAQGSLARDQAILANVKVDLQRYETLLAQDSIARQTVDTQRALVRIGYDGLVHKTFRGHQAYARFANEERRRLQRSQSLELRAQLFDCLRPAYRDRYRRGITL